MKLIYYTHNKKPGPFLERIYDRNVHLAEQLGAEFVAVVAEKFRDSDILIDFDPEPLYADIFRRMLAGLEGLPDDEPVFFIEDDCLYPIEHFNDGFDRHDVLFYNLNIAFLDRQGFFRIPWGNIALSQIHGPAGAVRWNIEKKLTECLDARMACVEPAGPGYRTATRSHVHVPCIDIRHGFNATWTGEDARARETTTVCTSLPGWAPADVLWNKYCHDIYASECPMCGGAGRVDLPEDAVAEGVTAWTSCPLCGGK